MVPTAARRSHARTLPVAAFALDLVAMIVTVVLAALGRDQLPFPVDAGDIAPQIAVATPAIAGVWLLATAALGGYQRTVFGVGTDEFRRVLHAWCVMAASIGIGCYLLKFPLPRGFFVLLLGVGLTLVMSGRVLLRQVVRRLRTGGALQNRVLIVGAPSHVTEVAEVLGRDPRLGYEVVAAATPEGTRLDSIGDVPVVGDASDVAALAEACEADIVFMAGGAVESSAQLRRVAWELEHTRTQLMLAPSVTDVAAERIAVRPVGGLPLIHLDKPRTAQALRTAKRTFDFVGASVLLLAFSPLFAFAAYAIKRHDGGPVFFRQNRVGRDGTTFGLWKFRTMVTDAEQRLAALHEESGYDGGLFKLAQDPRVTAPGRWLRRFSIDELPQLLNVLTGDMSLVGPRPPLTHEVAQYDDDMARRLHVRPGMTGLWQVSGRSDLSWSEAIRLDLYYVDNWSMVRDLSILAKTLGAVVGSRGAY